MLSKYMDGYDPKSSEEKSLPLLLEAAIYVMFSPVTEGVTPTRNNYPRGFTLKMAPFCITNIPKVNRVPKRLVRSTIVHGGLLHQYIVPLPTNVGSILPHYF